MCGAVEADLTAPFVEDTEMTCEMCGTEFTPLGQGKRKYCSPTCRNVARRLYDLKRDLRQRLNNPWLDGREFFLELLVYLFDDETAHRALKTYRDLRTPFEVMKANFRKLFCKEKSS